MAGNAPETSMSDPKRKVAVVLFAHGARDERWAEPFHRVTAAVRVAAPDIAVELAFLELMTPDLESAVHRLAAAGVSSIRVVPLFFGQGGHLRKDVPAIVAAIAQSLPDVAIELSPAAGDDEGVIAALAAFCVAEARKD
jgi:sirohydrochlorin cobaltochelatase